MASKFASLDELSTLQPQVYKKGDRKGKRKRTNHRNDEIGDALANCATASSIADFAHKVGITENEIADRASKASNFGNFRMILGNRIRGTINVLERAQKAGQTLTKAQAAARGTGKRYADPKDLPVRKTRVKKESPKAAAKENPKGKGRAKAKTGRMVAPKK